MSKIINLKQARKRRDRSVKETEASASAALHGRTKAERLAERQTAEAERKRLDGHKRDKP